MHTLDDVAGSTDEKLSGNLRPGTLVYLWPPGESPSLENQVLARVQRASQDTILGLDLGDRVEKAYEVGHRTLPGLRWSWEVAAELPKSAGGEVPLVAWEEMSSAERQRFMFGDGRRDVTVRLVNGDSMHGAPSRIVTQHGEPLFVELTGPHDTRGPIGHVARWAHISGVTR